VRGPEATRQASQLRQGEVLQRLVVVDSGRRGKTITAMAKENFIEIEFQNLVFIKRALNPESE
jgi:hypothetical protein